MGAPAETHGTSSGRSGGGTQGAAGLAALAGLAWVARDVPAALGGRLSGARARAGGPLAQFRDGTFHNPGRRPARWPPGSGRDLVRELIFGKQRRRPTATGAAGAAGAPGPGRPRRRS